MNNLKALVLAAAMLVVPIAANAQLAYTARTVPLHAGPAGDYPVVATLGSGFAVTVQGCLPDYSWCDVIAGEYRGWVDARNINHFYQGASVPVINYGAAIGIGVVTFVIGNYWQDHYIRHSWYRQMAQWRHRPAHAAIHPRPPQRTAHPQEWQRPAPARRPLLRPESTGVYPRPQQAGPRLRIEQSPTPASRPLFRPQSAGTSPQPGQRGAHPGRVQHRTPGTSQRFRHRP